MNAADRSGPTTSDDDFDPAAATEEQLTLYLARQGVSPIDLQKSMLRAQQLVQRMKDTARDERSWEEFELLKAS